MKFLLLVLTLSFFQCLSFVQTGTWYGQLATGDSTHFILDVRRNAEGLYAMLDIPEKGLLRMHADSISYAKKTLLVGFKGLQFNFGSMLSIVGSQI